MKFLIFIPPKDFKDESVSAVKMFFDRWGVNYQITSYSSKECVGYHGAVYTPDINTNKVDTTDYDGIMLIDGSGIDSYKLSEFRPLLDLMLRFNSSKKYIGAIGNAIKIVARANIIKDKKISMPSDEDAKRNIILFHGIPSEEPIEMEGNIATIRDARSLEGPLQLFLERIGVK